MYTVDDFKFALNWFGCRCAYCGRHIAEVKKLHLEHFIPISAVNCPGTLPTNVVPACKSCNSSKKDKDPIEWVKSKFGEAESEQILGRIYDFFLTVSTVEENLNANKAKSKRRTGGGGAASGQALRQSGSRRL